MLQRNLSRSNLNSRSSSSSISDSSLSQQPQHQEDNNNHDNKQSPSLSIDTPSLPISRSIMNLTTSALFGIYGPQGLEDKSEPNSVVGTPRLRPGNGSLSSPRTPSSGSNRIPNLVKRGDEDQTTTKKRNVQKSWSEGGLKRGIPCGVAGMVYGLIIAWLRGKTRLQPITLQGPQEIDLGYVISWGVLGTIWGYLMSEFDRWWDNYYNTKSERRDDKKRKRRGSRVTLFKDQDWRLQWNDIVRCLGAYVGLSFAIRRLPWQSSLQLSLTLALANPATWYLSDRTASGLIYSTGNALLTTILTIAFSFSNIYHTPTLASRRDHDLILGIFQPSSIAITTWIITVMFVGCTICGNIGRRL